MGLLKLLGIEKYLKKVKTYVDTQAQELNERINNIKPEVPTPDWDAASGQPGYIANKTHGLEDIVALTEDGQKATAFLPTAIIRWNGNYYSVKRGQETVISTGPYISVRYEGEEVSLNDPEGFAQVVPVYVAIAANPLDEVFIPDTIARKSDIPSVPAESKTAWQNYQEWSELTDGFWQNEEAYSKYLSVRDGMCGIDTRRPEYKYEHFEKWVSWDTYGFTWYQFVTIKDRNPEYATVEDYNSGEGMTVSVKDLEGESFVIRINPNNETIYLIGY